MYQTLLILHSLNRWLVLTSLIYSIWIAWKGLRAGSAFSKTADTVRHVTATITHVQLLLGLSLYMISPVVKFGGAEPGPGTLLSEHTFFQQIHIALAVIAVVLVTIGSSKAKREETDRKKFRKMLIWFAAGLLLMLAAIPWPFSPFSHRPYLRSF